MATTLKTLEVKCPGCGRQTQVDAQLAGRRMSCSRCNAVTRVPAARPATPAVQRDVDAEAHVVAMAVWQRITCMLGVIFSAWTFMSLTSLAGAPASLAVAAIALPLGVSVCYGALGFFLARYHHAARLITIVLSIVAILGTVLTGPSLLSVIPIGYNAAMIVVLLGERSAALCTTEYRQRVERTPGVSVPWAASPFFYLPIVMFVAALGIGAFAMMS